MQASGGTRLRRTGPVLAILAGLTVSVAACGGGSGGSSGSGPSGAGSSSQGNPARFAQCMRGHGVPSFPDPNSNGQFTLAITKGGSLDPNSATYKSALQACHQYDTSFGSSNGSGASNGNTLKFAQCMRSHGVTDFPDPRSGGGGLTAGGDVQSNPHFQSAMQACRPLLSGGGS